MKWIFVVAVAIGLTALGFSLSTPTLTTKAYASKMDGKPFGAESPKNNCFPQKCGGGAPKKSCSSYAQFCVSRTRNVSGCQAAPDGCMQTGTWRGPMGGVFSGVARE
jgi:hypothetical protein